MKNDCTYNPEYKIRLNRLKSVLGDVELTKGEELTLKWIAQQEDPIAENVISLIRQARKTEEVVPMWEEKLVYTVRVYLKDGTSDDYFADFYDEIEEICSDEDPDLHYFYNPEYGRKES